MSQPTNSSLLNNNNGLSHISEDGRLHFVGWYKNNYTQFCFALKAPDLEEEKTYIFSYKCENIKDKNLLNNNLYAIGNLRYQLFNERLKIGNTYYLIVKGLKGECTFHIGMQEGNEFDAWDFKLEEVKPGEPELPTDFCLSIEDIAKENEKLSKS